MGKETIKLLMLLITPSPEDGTKTQQSAQNISPALCRVPSFQSHALKGNMAKKPPSEDSSRQGLQLCIEILSSVLLKTNFM